MNINEIMKKIVKIKRMPVNNEGDSLYKKKEKKKEVFLMRMGCHGVRTIPARHLVLACSVPAVWQLT